MGDEKGLFGFGKKKEDKVMEDESGATMEESLEEVDDTTDPQIRRMEDAPPPVVNPPMKKAAKKAVAKTAAPKVGEKMTLANHPVMARKHRSIVEQKAAPARKYFRSK